MQKHHETIKALGLFSGGLDSIIAVKVMLEQGIDVTGIHFVLPFAGSEMKNKESIQEAADKAGIKMRFESMGDDYLEVIKHPKHGWGAGVNPCIDCKIFMLSKTKKIMDETGAQFVFTGEVLGQRPMSQHRRALGILERESGLSGKLLRPLSARYMKETIPESEGWVKRDELPAICGRNRDTQFNLAKKYNIDYHAPVAGGCLLTDRLFAKKMKDILEHKNEIDWDDVLILKEGRHFRFNENKIIAGRNQKENEALKRLKKSGDIVFELPDTIPGPTVILQGETTDESMNLAAALTLRYSDLEQESADILYGTDEFENTITGNMNTLEKLSYYNITSD